MAKRSFLHAESQQYLFLLSLKIMKDKIRIPGIL
jgi:hypothetical protein